MKILKIVVCTVVLACTVAPGIAQQADPPKGFRATIKAKYLEKRERYMARVKSLYFAVGCKVLASEAGILPLTSAQSYLAYIGDQTIIDTKDEELRQAAVKEGLEQAARPGECDYYRRHPEAAEAARKAAAEAAAKH
jgi:hypothetical protein